MKEYKGFTPRFQVDPVKKIIRGKVINVRDTITFHGKTIASAWKAFEKSVDDYLAFCDKLGVEPEKTFNGRILVRLTSEMHRQISEKAARKGTTINAQIQEELSRSLERGHSTRAMTVEVPGAKTLPRKSAAIKKKPRTTVPLKAAVGSHTTYTAENPPKTSRYTGRTRGTSRKPRPEPGN